MVEAGGIEPHTRLAAQELTPQCDQIVTVFPQPSENQREKKSDLGNNNCRFLLY